MTLTTAKSQSEVPQPEVPKETKWTREQSYTCGNNCPEGIKALEAIKRLVTSNGTEIDDCILRGFNQKGRWTFIDKLEFLNPPKEAQLFLANFTLPENRRTKVENNQTHLLTNFIFSETKENLEIPYASIDGCLLIKEASHVKAPNLLKVNGRVQMERAKTLKVPLLKEVNGDLNLRMARLVISPKLATVNGELDIYYAKSVSLPQLRNLKSLKFANLEEKDKKILLRGLSPQSLTDTLNSPSMKPSIQTDSSRRLIEDEIKAKTLITTIISKNNTQTLEI
jgi:hypothetical protein